MSDSGPKVSPFNMLTTVNKKTLYNQVENQEYKHTPKDLIQSDIKNITDCTLDIKQKDSLHSKTDCIMSDNSDDSEPKNNDNPNRFADLSKEMTMMVRQSFGIILVREHKNQYQALVTCRRTTYAFDAFVLGRYSVKNDKNRIRKMFDEMNMDELADINTLEFEKIWWRFRLKKETNDPFYIKKLNKFNASFMSDRGKLLRDMLRDAKPTGKLPYDFPKGRKQNNNETQLETSIREFKEETNIGLEHYVFLDDKTRYNTFISDGVKYKTTYYIAFLKDEVNIQLSLKRFNQLSEIKDIQWMDINDIRRVDYPDKRLQLLVQPVFKLVMRRIHGKTRFIPFSREQTL